MLEMLEMLEGRWKDRKAQERQPGSLRRPQRGGVCGAEFVAVFGAQDRGWFWLPCARMLQDSNEGLATCKNVEQCAPHTHLDKGDFMLKPVMKFPFVWHSLFVHFYRVHSGQMAVCFQDHDAKYLQLIRRTAKPTRRHRRSPALHNALAGNKKWRWPTLRCPTRMTGPQGSCFPRQGGAAEFSQRPCCPGATRAQAHSAAAP
jgi:hypothetical protein